VLSGAVESRRNMTISWHVSPWGPKKWAIRKTGSTRPYRLLPSRDAAMQQARSAAKKSGLDLVVHLRGGHIESIKSYAKTR
jgi:hypothetical protein